MFSIKLAHHLLKSLSDFHTKLTTVERALHAVANSRYERHNALATCCSKPVENHVPRSMQRVENCDGSASSFQEVSIAANWCSLVWNQTQDGKISHRPNNEITPQCSRCGGFELVEGAISHDVQSVINCSQLPNCSLALLPALRLLLLEDVLRRGCVASRQQLRQPQPWG